MLHVIWLVTLKGPMQYGGNIPHGVVQIYILWPRVLIILTEDWQRVGFFGGGVGWRQGSGEEEQEQKAGT